MKESYQLILNSQNSINRTGTLATKFQYYVQWESVLPRFGNTKYEKQAYRLTWTLRGVHTINVLTENLFVSVDLGHSLTCDQSNNLTHKIGVIYPEYVNTKYSYKAGINDNCELTLNYPSDNLVNVSFQTFGASTTDYASMENYVLILNFEPI